MKAMVVIDKSFDDSASFAKEWEFGDMKEFMSDEGKYLDELCLTLDDKGKDGDSFTVYYTVTVTK